MKIFRYAALATVTILLSLTALVAVQLLKGGHDAESPALRQDSPAILNKVEVQLDSDRIEIILHAAPAIRFPSPVDSNSPAFWRDGKLAVISSYWQGAFISLGDSIENLTETIPIDLPAPGRPGNVWMEAVWQDPESGVLYGWYHFEPEDLDCYPMTAPSIGAAVSHDGGFTWEDRGVLIENGYDHDCGYQNDWFVGGSGDFSVAVDDQGGYFYFLYSNYLGTPEEVGVAIARGAFEDRGQPGSVWKYYRGEWNEPGIGGRNTAIFRSRTGWQGPDIDAFWGPSVHWNHYLGTYVALLNRATDAAWSTGGIYISFSKDLLSWTTPQEILPSHEWYPQVIGLGEGESDSVAGKVMRVFVGGLSTSYLEFSKIEQQVRDPQPEEPSVRPLY